MNHQTDWRQQSAMESNQGNGRGWAFDPQPEPKSIRPWVIAGTCVFLFLAMCLLASVS